MRCSDQYGLYQGFRNRNPNADFQTNKNALGPKRTTRLVIEIKTLIIWLCNDLDLEMILTLMTILKP